MPYTTTFNEPPTPGTIDVIWEGWVPANDLRLGDVLVDTGAAIDGAIRELWMKQVTVRAGGETIGRYYNDEVFYIERKVRLTTELIG